MQRSLRVLHVAETLRGGPATYINNVVATISRPGSTLVLVPDRHADDLEIDRDCVRVFRSDRRGLSLLPSEMPAHSHACARWPWAASG